MVAQGRHRYRVPILTLLIVAGLAAIGISLYTQYWIPYQTESSLEEIDAKRIKDISNLDAALSRALATSTTIAAPAITASSTASTTNYVYISIPSISPTCADINLPTLADGWSYRCTDGAHYTRADGTGWLPVDLTKQGIPFLPTDPINTPDNSNFYAYAQVQTATSTHYALSTLLDDPNQ